MPQSSPNVQTEGTHAARSVGASPPFTKGLASVLCATALAGCWLMWGVADPGFDRYHLPKELTLSCAALISLMVAVGGGLQARLDRLDRLALVSLTVSAVSARCAISPALALRGISLELAVTVLFLTARRLDERGRSALTIGLVVAGLGVALVALAESFGFVAGLSGAGRSPGATLGQRNMVAHLLALASPCAWWLAATSSRRALRALGIVASACLAAALLYTRSRAGWLSLAAGAVVFLTVSLARARTTGTKGPFLLGLVAMIFGLVLAALAPTKLTWSTSTPYADTLSRIVDHAHGSGAGRLAQYRASLALVPDRPLLGVGPGNWMVAYPRVASIGELERRDHGFLPTGRLPNGDWIALLIERGVLGALCTLVLIASLARRTAQSRHAAPGLSAMAVLVVAGSFDAVLQVPAPACFAALFFAVTTPHTACARVSGPSSRVLALVLMVALAWTGWGATERALALWARTRPSGGYAAMEAAVARDAADLSARFLLAEAYALSGDCAKARPHLRVLQALLPYHRSPRELGCDDAPMPAVLPLSDTPHAR